jgi:predicted acyltransferase
MTELLTEQKSKRLISLDVFRGATIAFMITVNNPGSWSHIYAPLGHAKWFGCTPTDLVFPFFLFIVGVAMWFSFAKFGHKLTPEAGKKILKRTFLIFLIGLVLNMLRPADSFAEIFTKLRIVGVLQRIALCYGIASVLVLTLEKKKVVWISGIMLLAFYWLLLAATGGFEIENTLARRFDLWIMGANHVYNGYGMPFDPEGLLSTIPAIVTVILGYFTGSMIRSEPDQKKVVMKLIGRGVLFTLGGLLWGLFFPIGKPIWTSSYVLYTGGLAMIILGIAILFIDVLDYKAWAKPFVVFGANPLFIFVLSGLVAKTLVYLARWHDATGNLVTLKTWLYTSIFIPLAGGSQIDGSLLFALTLIAMYWLIADILYKKRIFIKI